MQEFHKPRPTLTRSLKRGVYVLLLKSVKLIVIPLVSIYAWIYLIPVLFPILKGPHPDRKPKSFHQVVMDAKKRVARQDRWNKELERRVRKDYRETAKDKADSSNYSSLPSSQE